MSSFLSLNLSILAYEVGIISPGVRPMAFQYSWQLKLYYHIEACLDMQTYRPLSEPLNQKF